MSNQWKNYGIPNNNSVGNSASSSTYQSYQQHPQASGSTTITPTTQYQQYPTYYTPAYQQQLQPPPPPPPAAYPINQSSHQQQAPTTHQQYYQQQQQQQQYYYPYNQAPVNPIQQQHQQHQPPAYPINYYASSQQGIRPPPPPPPPPPPSFKQSSTKTKTKIPSSTTPPSTTNTYKCESCSISFPTLKAYQSHTKSHIQCSHPDCTFTASKKVVSAHYASTHGKYSGRGLKTVTIQVPGSHKLQRFKICVGNHPEDIKSWIEERKKKFPTRKRMEKLQEKKKRKREEGGLFVKQMDVGTNDVKKKKIDHQLHQKQQPTCDESKNDVVGNKNDSKLENVLTNLACYGSSSEEDNNEDNNQVTQGDKKNTLLENNSDICLPVVAVPEEKTTTAIPNPKQQEGEQDQEALKSSKFKTKHCRYFVRNGTCKNGDQCTYIHDITEHEKYKSNAQSRRQIQSVRDKAKNQARREMNLYTTGSGGGSGLGQSGSNGGSGQTLLRKLLQNDIKRERSLCLQLIRYIVDCNFLQDKKEVKENSNEAIQGNSE